jgi:hypothetical protein
MPTVNTVPITAPADAASPAAVAITVPAAAASPAGVAITVPAAAASPALPGPNWPMLVPPWDASRVYAIGDCVHYEAVGFFATAVNDGEDPPGNPSSWEQITAWSAADAYYTGRMCFRHSSIYEATQELDVGSPDPALATTETHWRRKTLLLGAPATVAIS